MEIRLVCFLLFVFTTNNFCQSYSQEYNLDARAISLGESLVASQSGIPSADNNPATLAGYNKQSFITIEIIDGLRVAGITFIRLVQSFLLQ